MRLAAAIGLEPSPSTVSSDRSGKSLQQDTILFNNLTRNEPTLVPKGFPIAVNSSYRRQTKVGSRTSASEEV